jgi:predicted alpha/beta-hydrolase family hydrolase
VIETPAGSVSVHLQGPLDADALVVVAPGAGADMRHAFMEHFAEGVATRGLRICRFNFAYQEKGRRSPDRAPILEDTFRAVLDSLAEEREGKLLIAGGKSMGGRIASQVAAAGYELDGLLYLGYPLHPPGKPERLRDEHLYEIAAPMLFVEGTRDPFCPLETLERVRKRLPDSQVAVIDGGDHSFKVPKTTGRTTPEAWDEVVERSVSWVGSIAG